MKGIVPIFLTYTISSFIKNKKNIDKIISIFLDDIYEDINRLVWLPRCEQMMLDESNAGINKKLKKKKNISSYKRPSDVRLDNLENVADGQEGIMASIQLAQPWLSFYDIH